MDLVQIYSLSLSLSRFSLSLGLSLGLSLSLSLSLSLGLSLSLSRSLSQSLSVSLSVSLSLSLSLSQLALTAWYLVTYLPSHFHLIHLIYQSSSHSLHIPKFISFILSFIFVLSILYIIITSFITFTIFSYTHTTLCFSLTVSFIFHPILSLETRSVFR